MSSDNDQYTDYRGEVLLGTNNVTSWKRSVKLALELNVSTLLFRHITVGSPPETPIPKPVRPTRPTAATRDALSDYRDDIEIYKFESEEHIKQQDRLHNAKRILTDSVHDTIKPSLTDKDPREIWTYLLRTYSVPDTIAQSLLYAELGKVKLINCDNMQTYLSKIRNIKLDLSEHADTMSDSVHKNAILSGLTGGYGNLVEQVHMDAGMGIGTSIRDLEKKLFIQEALLNNRKQKRATARNNNSGKRVEKKPVKSKVGRK